MIFNICTILSAVVVYDCIFTGRNEVVNKVIFLHLFVILFTGRCLPQCMLGYHTHTSPPLEPTPLPPQSRHPLGADTPLGPDTSRDQTPPRAPPGSRHPLGADTPPEETPSREADSGIGSMSGRYASYWNAFLYLFILFHFFYFMRISAYHQHAIYYVQYMWCKYFM